jgi:hypothetical protein
MRVTLFPLLDLFPMGGGGVLPRIKLNQNNMIYVIRAGNSMMVKIGFTKNNETLRNRLKSLKSSCPFKLEIEAIMEGGKIKESCIHSFCISRHESGEWFRLSVNDVKRMVIEYGNWKPYHDGIKKMPKLVHQIRDKTTKQYFK